jgi:hypothetical protein
MAGAGKTDIKAVMVSSTVLDLPMHRQKVRDACERQGMLPLMMEHLPASGEDAIVVSRDLVDRADCYVAVIAHRYGHVPEGHDISITEMEYSRAVERGIPRLIFLMDAKHPVLVDEIEMTPAAQEKLRALKGRLETTNVVKRFKSPEELEAQVINSLAHARQADAASHSRASLAEGKARSLYLRDLREHLENLRHEALHKARFIDLGLSDSPAATQLLGVYRNPDATHEFTSLTDALTTYDHRLLLLAEPGGGKTTTLQHIALERVIVAQTDHAAPIPVLVNLSKFSATAPQKWRFEDWRRWPGRGGEKPHEAFARWLADEISTLYAVPRGIARAWVNEGRIAAFLDGLDEVVVERRAEIVRLLNATFLRDHPDIPVIVCSRVAEYEPLMANADTRLQLRGAVIFSPLNEPQVARYLAEAQADGLADALCRDDSMAQLARNPLILSLMTLAYGSSAAADIPSYSSQTIQRHRLMETFVSRMLQRKERRDRGIPFDDNRRADVPEHEYAWRSKKFNRYLSWLAIRLSVQSKTAQSLTDFWQLIDSPRDRVNPQFESWVKHTAEVMVVVGLLILTGAFMSQTDPSALSASASGAALVVAISSVIAALNWTKWRWWERFNFLYYVPFFFLAVGAWCRGIAALVPLDLNPLSVDMIALVSFITLTFGITVGVRNRSLWLALFVQIATAASLTWVYWSVLPSVRTPPWWPYTFGPPGSDPRADASLAALVIATVSHSMFWQTLARRGEVGNTGSRLSFLGMLACGAGVATVLAWSHAEAASLRGATAYALVGLGFLFFCETSAQVAGLVLATVGAIVGGMYAGEDGMFGGIAVWLGLAILGHVVLRAMPPVSRSPAHLNDLRQAAGRGVARVTLAPLARVILAATGRLPLRLRSFLRYGGQALVLKPLRRELEFSHRLLRDYFALRELVPRLRVAPPEERLEIIGALGYQGAAAIDTLAELSRHGPLEDRVAAVKALARISAPEVIELIRIAMRDPNREIRAAAVMSAANLPETVQSEIVALAADDADFEVQAALFTIASPTLREKLASRHVLVPGLLRHALIVIAVPHRSVIYGEKELPFELDMSQREYVITVLRQMARDADPGVREKAGRWMRGYKPIFDLDCLLELLRRDPDRNTRAAAADALARWGGVDARYEVWAFRGHRERRGPWSRVRTFIRNDLGRLTWQLGRYASPIGAVVLGLLALRWMMGPYFVTSGVNALVGAIVALAMFFVLYRPWYSHFGQHGTHHTTTLGSYRGIRQNTVVRRVTLASLWATVFLVYLFVKSPDWSPVPSYFIERIELETSSDLELWNEKLADPEFYAENAFLWRLRTKVHDRLDISGLSTLPRLGGAETRAYVWEWFRRSGFFRSESQIVSSAMSIALRPAAYLQRAEQLRLTGTISWLLQGQERVIAVDAGEARVIDELRQHPSIQAALADHPVATVSIGGWATLSLQRQSTEGPILIVGVDTNTPTAIAVLEPVGTFTAQCVALARDNRIPSSVDCQ